MRSTGGETEKERCGDGWESREGGETSSRQTANLARTMVCFSTLNTSTRCNFDSPFCNNDCLTLCFRSQFQLNIFQINITRLEFFLLLSFRHFYVGGILLKRFKDETVSNHQEETWVLASGIEPVTFACDEEVVSTGYHDDYYKRFRFDIFIRP